MIEHPTRKLDKLKPKFEDFSPEDLKVLAVIKKITNAGDNAEVKKKKDGGLTVYKVRKQIAVQ